MTSQVEIVAAPHPFSAEAVHTTAPEGLTIAEMLTGKKEPVALPLRVFAGDILVPQDMLHRVRPRAGTRLTVRIVLHGGGSGGGKDILRTVLMIAVIALAFAAPLALPFIGLTASATVFGGLTVGALTTAVVGTVGMLAVNALVPPRMGRGAIASTSGRSSSNQESPNYSISGARNTAQPFGIVPSVLGTHRMVPPLGARTYVETSGKNQYLNMLVVWGYGPLDISDIRIGDTPISSFEGVNIQTRQGFDNDSALTNYPRIATQLPLSVALTKSGGAQTRTTPDDTDRISVDISFPAGLVEIKAHPKKEEGIDKKRREVEIEISYRTAGSGSFTVEEVLTISAGSSQALIRGYSWNVSRGRYDVRLRRLTDDSTLSSIQDVSFWTSMRSFTNEDPIQFEKPLAKTALRIKATDQLNNAIDQLNGLVKSIAKKWNGASWQNNQITDNPGDLMRHVLQGPANARPVADAKIDLDAFADFADYCDDNGFAFNHIRDFESSVLETLSDIAAVGKATPALRDGKWTVLIDEEKTLVVQHFTPRNSWGFGGNKVFDDTPHAWRARFINAAKRHQTDERIVYADGFNQNNATKYEGIEFAGVTSSDHVWKLARYHMAVAQLRPETYSLFCDFENLVCTRGDLVRVSHDVPVWVDHPGGRVTKSVSSEGNIVSIRVDEPCEMVEGHNYVARFRLPSQAGQSLLVNLVTTPGINHVLTFDEEVATEDGPAVGDLFMFGLLDEESVELIVKSIEPTRDLSARLTLVDHSPAIHDASTGAIPEFDSQISRLPRYEIKPGNPVLSTIQSDLTVAAWSDASSISERIVITVSPPEAGDLTKVHLEAQIRFEDTEEYGPSITQSSPTEVYIDGVIGGEVYDIRIRWVASADSPVPGATGDWVEETGYTVVGKTELPEDVETMLLEGGYAIWDYDPPLDFKGFQLRFHRGVRFTWADADPAHLAFISETRFDISHLSGGTFTLLLKAIDSGGRESANAASLVVDLGDAIVDNVVLSLDYKAFDYFIGTPRSSLVNGVLTADTLAAQDTTLFWNVGDSGVFWNATPISAFWDPVFLAMKFETYFVPNTVLGGDISLHTEIAGESYLIRYRGNGDTPLWGDPADPLWQEDDGELLWDQSIPAYRAWPGQVEAVKRERLYFEVTIQGGIERPVISEFEVIQDVPDIIERLNDIAIGSGGTRLPITKTFRSIRNVNLTLQFDGGSAIKAECVDKNALSGPLVQCVNASLVGVTGLVDATIQGF